MDEADHNLSEAKELYRRASWEFMNSVRRGQRNDAWFDLANAIWMLWPEVDPDAPPTEANLTSKKP